MVAPANAVYDEAQYTLSVVYNYVPPPDAADANWLPQ